MREVSLPSSGRNTAAAAVQRVQPGGQGTGRRPPSLLVAAREQWEETAARMGILPRGYFPRNKRPEKEEYGSSEEDCGPGGKD